MARVQPIDAGQARVVRLGEGGFGTAYRLSGRRGDQAMVLKIMPERGIRARLSARLQQQIGAITALSHHEDMVTMVGWGTRHDRWYVAFEEAVGGSLAQLVEAGGSLEWRSAVRLGIRLGRVLELAHDLGVFHRDIKPANILLSADGRPLLTDLGLGTLACSFSLDTPAAADSLAVAAPEASRTMSLTAQSDIYALAATMRLLLGGRHGAGRRRGEPPPALIALLDRATAREPERRPSSMSAFRADLELFDDRAHRPLHLGMGERRAS